MLITLSRGTQRQFSENICSEDDLRSRIFGTLVVKISCLPASPNCSFFNGCLPERVDSNF